MKTGLVALRGGTSRSELVFGDIRSEDDLSRFECHPLQERNTLQLRKTLTIRLTWNYPCSRAWLSDNQHRQRLAVITMIAQVALPNTWLPTWTTDSLKDGLCVDVIIVIVLVMLLVATQQQTVELQRTSRRQLAVSEQPSHCESTLPLGAAVATGSRDALAADREWQVRQVRLVHVALLVQQLEGASGSGLVVPPIQHNWKTLQYM